MPHDLFGSSLVRPASARSRRSSIVFVSVVAHAIVLAALIIVPLVASDVLPIPQRAIAFFTTPDVRQVVPVPPPLRRAVRAPGPTTMTSPTAPLKAPEGISPETGIENLTVAGESNGPPSVGAIEGIDAGQVGRVEAPPPPPPAPIHLHAGMRAPQKIVDVKPVYPEAARAARMEGIVIIEATIDARGRVETARILKHVPLLDEAALEAVRHWTFTPALLNGVPVPVIMTVTVIFSLR